MQVPAELANAFGPAFEELISGFAHGKSLLPDTESIRSTRFLSRAVVPHVHKLSSLFNREAESQSNGLAPYWKASSNPAHLRLAYFLYFMPSNLFRVGAVWSELERLGYRWPEERVLRGLELGAGPASGACGIAAAERFRPTGIPKDSGNWALIEQDKTMLQLGADWARTYFDASIGPEGSPTSLSWEIRPFHRKLDFSKALLPPKAPKFNLIVMSYVLNEVELPSDRIARTILQLMDHHLDNEGLLLLVEPALRLQSRRLLEVRAALQRKEWLRILLPCLGDQACGALQDPEDWCHEEVMWWRPPYFRIIDQLAELDRKSLPFSYLVLAKSKRPLEAILPSLGPEQGQAAGDVGPTRRHRLVSPAHAEGSDQEFFICGAEGKRRARYRSRGKEDPADQLNRGSILLDADIRGDTHASRVERIKKVR